MRLKMLHEDKGLPEEVPHANLEDSEWVGTGKQEKGHKDENWQHGEPKKKPKGVKDYPMWREFNPKGDNEYESHIL